MVVIIAGIANDAGKTTTQPVCGLRARVVDHAAGAARRATNTCRSVRLLIRPPRSSRRGRTPSGFPVATTERETPAMRRGKIVREATGNMRVAGVSRHPGAAGRSGWDLRQRIWYGCEWLPPNGLAFSCRERAAQDHVKIAPISRAKRSAAMPGWAGAPIPCQVEA